MAGTQILGIAYGLDIHDAQDTYITDARAAVEAFSKASVPGAYLVDTFPFCTYFLKLLNPGYSALIASPQ